MIPTEQLMEFIGNNLVLAGAFVVVAALIVGNEIARNFRGYREIASPETIKLMNQFNAIVLDVRDPGKFRERHIVGARNMPLSKFEVQVNKFKNQHDTPIIAYCDTGADGLKAAASFKKAGFTKVFSLKGGLNSWKQDNLLTEGK